MPSWGQDINDTAMVPNWCTVITFGLYLVPIPRFTWYGAAWASLATDGGLAIAAWVLLAVMRRRTLKPWPRCISHEELIRVWHDTRTVAIFRERLLPVSETFIAAQAAVLKDYDLSIRRARSTARSPPLNGRGSLEELVDTLAKCRAEAYRQYPYAPVSIAISNDFVRSSFTLTSLLTAQYACPSRSSERAQHRDAAR